MQLNKDSGLPYSSNSVRAKNLKPRQRQSGKVFSRVHPLLADAVGARFPTILRDFFLCWFFRCLDSQTMCVYSAVTLYASSKSVSALQRTLHPGR